MEIFTLLKFPHGKLASCLPLLGDNLGEYLIPFTQKMRGIFYKVSTMKGNTSDLVEDNNGDIEEYGNRPCQVTIYLYGAET